MRKFLFIGLLAAFSGHLNAQNYYSVKFPDDLTIFACGASPDTIWHMHDAHMPAWHEYGASMPWRKAASSSVSLPRQTM